MLDLKTEKLHPVPVCRVWDLLKCVPTNGLVAIGQLAATPQQAIDMLTVLYCATRNEAPPASLFSATHRAALADEFARSYTTQGKIQWRALVDAVRAARSVGK